MKKLIMWNLITLDGYFEGTKSWDLAWHQYAMGEAFDRFAIKQLKTTDRLLFGRVTYEGMAAYWAGAEGEVAELMNSLPKTVFSSTLERADWSNTTLVSQDPVVAVRELKEQGDGNIFVFGSGRLCDTLRDSELFDEYRFGVTSVILGHGRPLFSDSAKSTALRLLDAQQLSAGCIVLRYEPER